MPVPTNPVFPSLPGIVLPARKIIWRSIRQSSIAGADVVSDQWTYPRYQWGLSAEFLRRAAFFEFESLFAFFNTVRASKVFMYADADDYTVTDQALGSGDGVKTAFQLLRAFGGFTEPVFAANVVTNVKVNGVVMTPVTDYTVSNKGVVTFAVAPGVLPVTWTGTYLYFCRMDDDTIEFSKLTAAVDSQGPIWKAPKITFTSIKFGA